jgi:hypothetical protein
MAKKRKSSSDAAASLDSFLDTLFNVAGILVIIIALAQITAQETIKDVNTGKKSQGGITAEMLAQKQRDLEQATRKRDGKTIQFNGLRSRVDRQGKQVLEKNNEAKEKKRALKLDGEFIPISDLKAQMETAKTRAEDLNATWIDLSNTYTNILAVKDRKFILAQLEKARAEQDSNQTAEAAVKQSLQELQIQLDRARTNLIVVRGVKTREAIEIKLRVTKKDRDQKKRDFEEKQNELVETEKLIAERTMYKAMGKTTIPIPRDAPKGKEHYGFVCRYNRITEQKSVSTLYFNWSRKYGNWLEANQALIVRQAVRDGNTAQQAINKQLKREWLKFNPVLDGPILKGKFFNVDCSNFPVEGATLRWPNKRIGDTPKEIWAANSAFRKQVEKLANGKKHYIRFYVYADSFEVYLAARKIAGELKLEAGWVPFENTASLTWGGASVGDVD